VYQEKATFRPYSGRKISVEGIDGSGKTTQTLIIKGRLQEAGYRVFIAPDNSDASEGGLGGEILSMLKGGKDRFFRIGHPVTENLLLASRAAYLDNQITLPKLRSGRVVLADRDVDTFVVYGMPSLRSEFPDIKPDDLMDWMYGVASLGRTPPDLTILFKPAMREFLPRARIGTDQVSGKDVFTKQDLDFMSQVVIFYDRVAKYFPERIKMVDVRGKTIEEVSTVLLELIIPFLEQNNVPKTRK